jgi:hypothetical protein
MPSRFDAGKLHRPYKSFGQWPQIWYAMNERAAKKAEEGLIKGLFYISIFFSFFLCAFTAKNVECERKKANKKFTRLERALGSS